MSANVMVLQWKNEKNLDKLNSWKFDSYVVRVLKEDEKYDALDLIMRALFTTKNDPIVNALLFDPVSVESLRSWIKAHLDQNIAYGCFLTSVLEQGKKKNLDKFKLIAVDVLYVRNYRDEVKLSKNSGEAYRNFLTYIRRIEKHVWSFTEQKRTNILISLGIFVSDEYRKNTKIAIETMKIRTPLARNLQMILGAAFIRGEMLTNAEKEKLHKLHHFTKIDCKELGLDGITQEEYIKLNVFPIIVMGYKPKRKGPTVAETIEAAHSHVKKIKREE